MVWVHSDRKPGSPDRHERQKTAEGDQQPVRQFVARPADTSLLLTIAIAVEQRVVPIGHRPGDRDAHRIERVASEMGKDADHRRERTRKRRAHHELGPPASENREEGSERQRMGRAAVGEGAVVDVAIQIGREATGDREQASAEGEQWIGRGEDRADRGEKRGREADVSPVEDRDSLSESQQQVD